MKWGNRLATVVRLRSIHERRARAVMIRQLLAEGAAAERSEQSRVVLEATRLPSEPLRPATLRSFQLRSLAANEQVESAVAEEQAATLRLAEARRQWSRTVAERDATEELDKRRSEAAAHLARVAADRSLDHLVAARSWERRP